MAEEDAGDWVSRLSQSLREHESSRIRFRATLPRYEIRGEVGRGGMGVIYRAWDPKLGREVALKVLPESAGDSAEARERLLREAQLAAQLSHPNIVPVHDSGEHAGQIYLAMQLVDGTTLDRAGLDPKQALTALRDAARAVHHAHEHGIIHRDLKPSNLMVDRHGRVYVMDFGLARRRDVGATLTLSGVAMGTPSYMSPEQARGKTVDARSDVYSLGATMYEVLSGRPPFSGPNAMDVLKHVLLDEPPFPRLHNPSIPRDLEAVIVKAMSKAPAGRYASAAELADDLDRVLKGDAVHAPMRGTFYRLRKKVFRHRWRVLAWTSLGALLAVGALSFLIIAALSEGSRSRVIEDAFFNALHQEKFTDARREVDRLRATLPERAGPLGTLLDLAEQLHESLDRLRRSLKEGAADSCRRELDAIRRITATSHPLLAKAWTHRRIEALESFCNDRIKASEVAEAERLIAEIRRDDSLRADLLERALQAARSGVADAARKKQLDDLERELLQQITREEAGPARRSYDALSKTDPGRARGSLAALLRLEFASGMEVLGRAAAERDVETFEKTYRALEAPDYEGQPDSKSRLGRAALDLGQRLDDPAAIVRWLDEAESKGERPAKLYERRGVAHVRLKGWDAADRDYFELLKHLGPGVLPPAGFSPLLHHRGGESARAGRWSEAFQRLSTAVDLDSSHGAAWHDLGRARLRIDGPVEKALSNLETALEKDPLLKPHADFADAAARHVRETADRTWKLDRREDREKAWRAADDLLTRLLERAEQEHAGLRAERAKVRRRQGRYDEAMADASRLPETPDGLRIRGEIEYVRASGEPSDAEGLRRAAGHFERALRVARNDATLLYWSAVCAQALGDPKGAAENLVLAVPGKPSFADVRVRLGDASAKAERLKEAIEHAVKGLEAAASFTETEFVAGLHERSGRSAGDARRRIQCDLHVILAGSRCKMKSFEAALADAQQALIHDPDSSPAHFWAGMAHYEKKQYGPAVDHFDRALKHAPTAEERRQIEPWRKSSEERRDRKS